MRRLFAIGVFLPLQLIATTVATNVHDMAAALKSLPPSAGLFDLTATVSCVLKAATNTIFVAFQDETGHAWARGPHPPADRKIRPGDKIRLVGQIHCGAPAHTAQSQFSVARVLEHGLPIRAIPSTAREISAGGLDWTYLSIRGLVRDVYKSETSQTFAVLILADGSELLRVNIPILETRLSDLTALIGCEIRLNGFPNLNDGSYRSFAGREFHCAGLSEIAVLKGEAADSAALPTLETLLARTTTQIATSGKVRARGTVICTWDRKNALVRTKFDDVFQIRCPQGNLPGRGEFIEATGLPLSDNFHITLTHVRWRPCERFSVARHKVTDILDFAKLTLDHSANKAKLHGRPVKIHGKVRSLPDAYINANTILLEDGTSLISLDVSSLREPHSRLMVGCEVEATGIYAMVPEYAHVGFPVSKVGGCLIILNDPADIRIVRNPPWWTVGRLSAAIGTLMAVLFGILGWNIALRRAATRKSRELFRAQLGQVKADLRTEERTRLAVELHDTLAQNLTGVSMEIEAANDLRGDAPRPMLDHLGIAAKALKSCRDELRNCLWDLRSQALEESDMSKAILRTLQPIVADSRLAVRFEVPRSRLSDNTAHALLRVIRELVVNAIRHGNASSVKVAGTTDGDRLLCSVTDNGKGFDPDDAPGILQGHFGLQGIRERIDELGGDFTIESSCGKGTKVTITIPIPHSGGGASEVKSVI